MKSTSQAVTESVAAGLSVYLLRPADWPRWVRWTYVAAPALLVTGVGALMAGLVGSRQAADASTTSEETLQRRITSWESSPLPARIAMVAGAGGAMAAAQVVSLKVDASVERWLSRRGVRHPRLLMGTVVAVVSLMELISTSGDESRQPEAVGDDSGPAPVSTDV